MIFVRGRKTQGLELSYEDMETSLRKPVKQEVCDEWLNQVGTIHDGLKKFLFIYSFTSYNKVASFISFTLCQVISKPLHTPHKLLHVGLWGWWLVTCEEPALTETLTHARTTTFDSTSCGISQMQAASHESPCLCLSAAILHDSCISHMLCPVEDFSSFLYSGMIWVG